MRVRGYRFRYYPSPRQERHLARAFGTARWTWNFALDEMSRAWRERGDRVGINTISRRLTRLKKTEKP
jgi:putative transposase